MASEDALQALTERAARVREALDGIKQSFKDEEKYSPSMIGFSEKPSKVNAGCTPESELTLEDQEHLQEQLRQNTDQIQKLMNLAEGLGAANDQSSILLQQNQSLETKVDKLQAQVTAS